MEYGDMQINIHTQTLRDTPTQNAHSLTLNQKKMQKLHTSVTTNFRISSHIQQIQTHKTKLKWYNGTTTKNKKNETNENRVLDAII